MICSLVKRIYKREQFLKMTTFYTDLDITRMFKNQSFECCLCMFMG